LLKASPAAAQEKNPAYQAARGIFKYWGG